MSAAARSSAARKGTTASVTLLIVFLAAWQWGPGLVGIPPFIVPPLSMVAEEFARDWQTSHLLLHTGVTAGEVLAGFLLGSLLGAFVGYLLGMSPTAELAFRPTFWRCRSRRRLRSRHCLFCGWALRFIRKSW